MTLIWTIIKLIAVLSVVATIHEFGHFLFAKLFKMTVNEFSIGFGNHDPQPLRQIANGVPEKIRVWDASEKTFKTIEKSYKEDAISPLAEELKIEPQKLQNPVEFAKAKFAEPHHER